MECFWFKNISKCLKKCVAYWPSAELSIKRCTCVNNRCIRSKISGYNLDCGCVELGADVTRTRNRCSSNKYITRCHRQVELVRDKMLLWEPAPKRGLGPQDPQLSSQAERKWSAANYRGIWGQYVAVCSVSKSPLSHKPFQPFRIKCERCIFLKNCVCSSLLLILFPRVYVNGCDYTTSGCQWMRAHEMVEFLAMFQISN